MQSNNQERTNPPNPQLNQRVQELLSQWYLIPLEEQSQKTPPPYLQSSHEFFLPSQPSQQKTSLGPVSGLLTDQRPVSSRRKDLLSVAQPEPRLPEISRDGSQHITARENISVLESAMAAGIASGALQPVVCSWKHYFSPGIYIREITMPAGSIITGQIHRHEHLNIIVRGDVSVITQDGWKRITVGPGEHFVMSSPAGMKRALRTYADTVWMTVHLNPTNETDPDKLVSMLTAVSFEHFEQLQLEHTP
jgi:hypothetical protein